MEMINFILLFHIDQLKLNVQVAHFFIGQFPTKGILYPVSSTFYAYVIPRL